MTDDTTEAALFEAFAALHPAPEASPARIRHDGWTPDRQRRFLEAVAEGHTVDDACAIVGMSAASAYAFRRRAAGAGFALGWHGANLLARDRIADTLLARALQGQTEHGTRPDGGSWSRHRYDNNLASRMLARLDAQADDPAAAAAHHAARIVAQEFDGFLDLLDRDAGPARAALFLAARGEDRPDVERVVALARADRFLQGGGGLPDEVDVSDCDPARRAHWTLDQWRRAEAAGLLRLAEPEPPAPPPPPPPAPRPLPPFPSTADAGQLPQLCERYGPVWWDEEADEWRTSFPPPRDFDGESFGRYGDDYERTLSFAEEEQIRLAQERAGERAAPERDAWFADLLASAQPAAADDARDTVPGDDEPAPLPHVEPPNHHDRDDSMSIFGKIKTAIFGKDGGPFGDGYIGHKGGDAAKDAPVTQTKTVPVHIPDPVPGANTPPQTFDAEPTSNRPTDVEAVLKAREAKHPGLNWRTSIVDLMKLLDLDSSLENRKELATELGYTGAKDGSAEMNIWLHKAVMRELAANGGTVPADLRD
ncbi:DUF3597 domain-containing protein [Sphingomonas sp. ac-8]|uniref:DUF3597 domain-containing protein n=1 Tax=Sphingomonas sp. ac-8 TaxID=3242977 RepID=UPI003A80B8BA